MKIFSLRGVECTVDDADCWYPVTAKQKLIQGGTPACTKLTSQQHCLLSKLKWDWAAGGNCRHVDTLAKHGVLATMRILHIPADHTCLDNPFETGRTLKVLLSRGRADML